MMDLGYLVSNGRYIDCADNDFASFACLSSHLDSCLDSLIEMSSSRFRMKIENTLKVKRTVLYVLDCILRYNVYLGYNYIWILWRMV